MKINFTKKEYRSLVTMIEIADWVLHAHRETDQPNTLEYSNLRNKILSYVKEMGMEDCYTKSGDEYYETVEFEENSEHMQFIEAYNEDSFWDELVSRLVDRDFEQQFGSEKIDIETRIEKTTEIEEIYADEVNQHGILNLSFNISNGKKRVH